MCSMYSAQKTKLSIQDLFSKFDQVRSFQRIWQHLPKKSLMENFIFSPIEPYFYYVTLGGGYDQNVENIMKIGWGVSGTGGIGGA